MSTFKINAALGFSIFFWASAFVGIRIGLTGYSPGSLALLRFISASVCMYLINKRTHLPHPIPWPHRLQMACLGILGIAGYNVLLNYGEVSVSAGVASFIIGLMPVFTVILSIIYLKEQQTWMIWLGIGVSFIGLSLMVFGGEAQHVELLGVIYTMLAALSGAIFNLVQKFYLRLYNPIAVTAWMIWGGTVALLVFAPTMVMDMHTASMRATLVIVYLGIFPAALAYTAWGYVLYHLRASRAMIYMYILPVVSTILGFVILGERVTMLTFVGGLISLGGACLASYSKIPAKTARETI